MMRIRKFEIINRSFVGLALKKMSFISKIKRHFDSIVEPGGFEKNSALQDTNTSMHSNMRQFQSYLTKNAYDMSINNEYDLWPHTNFGTIDNPLLVFSAGTTWRYINQLIKNGNMFWSRK
jgi:hypothetical protein